MGKESACNAGDIRDVGSISGSERSLGGWYGNPLQYSCLENPMDKGSWWAMVHRVAKSQTQLSNWAHTLRTNQPTEPRSLLHHYAAAFAFYNLTKVQGKSSTTAFFPGKIVRSFAHRNIS